MIAAFLPQYYLGGAERELPGEIIVNAVHEDLAVIADALAQGGQPAQVKQRIGIGFIDRHAGLIKQGRLSARRSPFQARGIPRAAG